MRLPKVCVAFEFSGDEFIEVVKIDFNLIGKSIDDFYFLLKAAL